MALTNSFYSYVYVDPRSDEPFYVGKGKRDRAYTHLKGSHNQLVERKINKIRATGQEPLVVIMETSTEKFAFMLEQGLIKLLGRIDKGTGTLCNFTDGGEGTSGVVVSDEHKRKVSEKLKGIVRGPLAAEHRQKMMASKKANPTGTGRWMNKDGKQVKVKTESVDSFIADGWSLGRDTSYITDEYKAKMKTQAIKQWSKTKEQPCL